MLPPSMLGVVPGWRGERGCTELALSVGTYIRTYVSTPVRSVTLSCLEGFLHNLAEVITIMRQYVARKNQVLRSKVKVTLKGQVWICVQSITLSCLE